MRNRVKYLTDAGRKRMASQLGIIYDKTTRDVLRVHNKNESWGHFLTKAVLYKLFRDRGYTVVLEAESVHGVIDVFVVDLKLAIEVVSAAHSKKVESTIRHYEREGEVVVVAVPHMDLDDFCLHVEEQVQIWL